MALASTPRLPATERRAAILKAALKLFSKRGFRGTTTRELAAAVGVSEPVLYEHFSSKRELYEAIIQEKCRERVDSATNLLTPLLDDDRAYFETLADFILQRFVSEPEYSRIFLHIGLEGGSLAQAYYERQVLFAQRLLAEHVQTRVEKGAFRHVDPQVTARMFLSVVVNQGLLLVLFRENFRDWNRKEFVRQMVDIFLKGVLNQAPEGADESKNL